MRIIVMKTAEEIEPYKIGGLWVTCYLFERVVSADGSERYTWSAQLRIGAPDAPIVHSSLASTPDEATRDVEFYVGVLAAIFGHAKAVLDVRALPGCSGEEMMPLDEVSP